MNTDTFDAAATTPQTPHGASEGSAPAMRLYTPTQAACGALLGGPMGVIYFLWANFRTLGRPRAARATLVYGMLGFVGLLALIMLLPRQTPSLVFTLTYALVARHVVRHLQMSREAIAASDRHRPQSNWRVAGIGLLCALLSLALAVPVVIVLILLGLPLN